MLDLSFNQLNSPIPESFGNLSRLTKLYLNNNQFTYTGLENATEKLSPHLGVLVLYPQATVPLKKQDNLLSISVGGTPANNTYKWYLNGTLFSTTIGDSVLAITQPGLYNVVITNKIARLTLNSDTISITSLPLTLLNFEGSSIKNTISLNWKTTNEINTKNFSIARSANGVDFTTLGVVNAANTTGIHNYNFVDTHPFDGVNYFRLLTTDKDGSYISSKTISIKLDTYKEDILVYPNPAADVVSVIFDVINAGKYSIKITDLTGTTISNITTTCHKGSNKINFNLARHSSGIYILTLVDSNNNKKTIRFTKL